MAKRQAAKRSAGRTSTTRKARTTSRKRAPAAASVCTSYAKAVAAYERGLAAIQRHDYARARETLAGILTSYPEERELLDRVRLYLQVCERQSSSPAPAPQTVEERLYAATVALNAGDSATAQHLLAAVQAEDPDNDHALYMLGVARSINGDHDAGLELLRRAIALNPNNRALARHDPELETLRSTDAFKQLLDTAAQTARQPRTRRNR